MLLARARRAFAIAGLVSVALAEHATPARDAYTVGDRIADTACTVLDTVVGPELIADLRRGEAGHLARIAELDLTFDARIGEPVIDDAMVTLTAALCDLLDSVAGNERALPEQRHAAAPSLARRMSCGRSTGETLAAGSASLWEALPSGGWRPW